MAEQYALVVASDPLLFNARKLLKAAEVALEVLEQLSTEDFERGGDKPAREALRAAIRAARGGEQL